MAPYSLYKPQQTFRCAVGTVRVPLTHLHRPVSAPRYRIRASDRDAALQQQKSVNHVTSDPVFRDHNTVTPTKLPCSCLHVCAGSFLSFQWIHRQSGPAWAARCPHTAQPHWDEVRTQELRHSSSSAELRRKISQFKTSLLLCKDSCMASYIFYVL